MKRQRSAGRIYWTVVDSSGRYLASLGNIESLGDPPKISRSALRELAQRKGLALEELLSLRGLQVLDEEPKEDNDEGPSGRCVKVRFVGLGSFLLNGVALFRPGDVKDVPADIYEEKFKENPAFERV